MSVRPSLKISVTTELIGFYSSGYIPIGPVDVLSYFWGDGTPPTSPKKNKSGETTLHKLLAAPEIFFVIFFKITSWGKAPRV